MASILITPQSGIKKWDIEEGDSIYSIMSVDFHQAYVRCRSGRKSWKPNQSFFKSLPLTVSTLIVKGTPSLDTVKHLDVYHNFPEAPPTNRIYLVSGAQD